MSAEESERERLPFEPNKKRQKPLKTSTKSAATPQQPSNQADQKRPYTKEEMAIPKVVSQRMVRRVAVFCGVPTALAIGTLIVSYLLAIYFNIKLAPIAVLLVNMGLFGLGVLGITYGVLSASWDEERAGSLFGLSEFGTNWGRMLAVWRETRQKNS
ncbi:PAM68 family protein [Nostoc sp. PA-18-2419]|uniref:PAM68 family protein n=1 Tax=Nostoc sp. PA-18-2419 TaxID=2575443 RepID=UPI00110846CE|nr:PAM68 family protein [Nostoc sp. PA-18-2419]